MTTVRKLVDKVAIITGAASGIGKAIAELYLEHGAHVVAVDLPGKELGQTGSSSDSIHRVEVDVTATAAPDVIVGAAIERFGGLDILVNNAGIAAAAQFEDITDETWERLMAINVTAIFRVSRAAVPRLRERGGGRIINTGSIMSSTAGPTLSAYGTSKHAFAGLTRGMAVDLGKYGITVNYLAPGSIWTGLSQPFFDDPGFREYWENKAPMGRIGDPIDVAVAALFLASDEAKFISGAGLAIDGGAGVNF